VSRDDSSLGWCLQQTKLIFTKLPGSFAIHFVRTPPYSKQNKNLMFSFCTGVTEINAKEML
jgi:hypothetical protein